MTTQSSTGGLIWVNAQIAFFYHSAAHELGPFWCDGDCRMRTHVLALIMAANIAVPALAQAATTTIPPGWVPPGTNPETGARPGNVIGTGMSLPTSEKAGNISPQDTTSPIAARLPEPSISAYATVRDLLVAARIALVAGHTGEAQEALERAETRTLDRSVPLFQTSTPASDPLVTRISQALHALGDDDVAGALHLVSQAIAQAPA